MRIFLSCQQAVRRHAVPAYSFWERYFKNGLTEAGHTWTEAPGLDWAEGLTPLASDARRHWLEQTWTRAVECLRKEHARQPVDFFLSYLFPNQVEPAGVRAIRDLGIPCVNFFCDNVREFTRVPEAYRAFDLHWVPEAEAGALYAAAGLAFVHAPMPVWVPESYRSVPDVESDTVVFIGSHDPLREDLLGEAVERGLPLRVYGDGWCDAADNPSFARPGGWIMKIVNQVDFWRAHGLRGFAMRATYRYRPHRSRIWMQDHCVPSLTEAPYFKVSRESRITLGINRYPSFRHSFRRPHRYSRLRDIEAPMLGACYLTEWAPGLDELYEPGREIEIYRGVEELVELADRLQHDPSRRRQLRVNGQRRALSAHTITRSLSQLARKLGLTA